MTSAMTYPELYVASLVGRSCERADGHRAMNTFGASRRQAMVKMFAGRSLRAGIYPADISAGEQSRREHIIRSPQSCHGLRARTHISPGQA